MMMVIKPKHVGAFLTSVVILARSYSAIPDDDGDYIETCWSNFNISFNLLDPELFF